MSTTTPSTIRKTLLGSAAALTFIGLSQTAAQAQSVEITDARTTAVETSTEGDVDVTTAGSITTTDTTALRLDSDNAVNIDGTISYEDLDDVTAVNIEGGNTGSFTLGGALALTETYEQQDTDDDLLLEGAVAEGSGRTGILISGASAYTGDVTTASASTISIEGNSSAGVRLEQTASLIGNLTTESVTAVLAESGAVASTIAASSITVAGADAVGVDVLGNVTGDVLVGGAITTLGENAQGINIAGDVDGSVTVQGALSNRGYTYSDRFSSTFRDLLDPENVLEGGSALTVSGDVTDGVYIANTVTTVTVDDASADVVLATPSITQYGSAPAVKITGSTIGLVADITDDTDENYDESLQYGLINEGAIASVGVIDDVSGTALRIENATITGGASNEGSLTTTTYRSGITGTDDDIAGDVAHAYGVSLGSGASLSQFRNSNSISATANEAADQVFADEDNVLEAHDVNATAFLIESGASLQNLDNTGTIRATLVGRQGTASAIVDQSDTLTSITNTGFIFASGTSSNTDTLAETPEFTLVAIDVSSNTNGLTINQSTAVDNDTTDNLVPVEPVILGDILFGSGADSLISSGGGISGDVSFGAGADALTLDSTTFRGNISNSGILDITLANSSTLLPTDPTPYDVTSASFDDTSTLFSIIDSSTNSVSTLNATGAVDFASGAQITPVLSNIVGNGTDYTSINEDFTIVTSGGLTLGDDISAYQPTTTPVLYDVTYSVVGDDIVASVSSRDLDAIGLDSVQLGADNQVFNAVYESLVSDDDLGSAFSGLTDETEFVAAYNQILPEFSAAVTQFISANVDGATGSVSSHLNNARLSQERPGGAWIEEFGYFADREKTGLSEAYRGYGFGFTGGFDTQIGPFHTAGINVGFATTEVEDVLGIDDPLAMLTLQAGLYAGYEMGNLGIDGYIGGGYNKLESTRNVEIGSYTASADADWTGLHYNLALNAGYDIAMGEKYFIRPSVGLSYVSMTEDAYEETGTDAFRLIFDERQSEVGSVTALLNFGARYDNGKRWIQPTAHIGARNDFAGGGVTTQAEFAGTNRVFSILSGEFPSNALIFGMSVAVGSKYSSFGMDYDADLRDGYNSHTLRLVLRMLF